MKPKLKLFFEAYLSPILKSYSEIFFMRSWWIGLGIFILSFCLNINIALSGVLALFFTISFIKILKMNIFEIQDGVLLYNPILVGFAIGVSFKLNLSVAFLIFCASLMTFLLTLILRKMFAAYEIPLLSLPFSIAAVFIYLATKSYGKLFYIQNYHSYPDQWLNSHLPAPLVLLCQTVGGILFIPSTVFGVGILVLLCCKTRVLPLMMALGLYCGLNTESLFVGTFSMNQHIPHSFNYILSAAALSCIFVVPGPSSILIGILGISLNTLLIDAFISLFSGLGIPVFALPFNISTILVVFTLKHVRFPELPFSIKETPEESSEYFYHQTSRFKSSKIQLSLPFKGEWSVYQGFDGNWTHQGLWKYAYDFNALNKEQRSHGSDVHLESYFCFGKEVMAPVSGYIHSIIGTLNDNPIGKVDTLNNWGNFVLIRTNDGIYVLLAHLKKNSITRSIGEWVSEGEVIGSCGNSGYSPEPHLHVQVQASPILGAETLPFIFTNYFEENEFINHGLPLLHSKVSALEVDLELEGILSFNLTDRQRFIESLNGIKKEVELEVKMCPFSGAFYFEDGEGNKLFFAKNNQSFYFFDYLGSKESALLRLFKLIPKIPFYKSSHFFWTEDLPDSYFNKGLNRLLKSLVGSLFSLHSSIHGRWKFQEEFLIEGYLVDGPKKNNILIELDPCGGFKMAKENGWELKRVS